MRIFFALLVPLFLLGACAGHGQPASAWKETAQSRKEAARELVGLTSEKELVDRAQKEMLELFSQQIKQVISSNPRITARQKEKLIAAIEKAVRSMPPLVDIKVVREAYIDIYAREFTEQELRELIAIAKNPVQRKFMSKIPVILRQTMERLLPQFEEGRKRFEQELRKELSKNNVIL